MKKLLIVNPGSTSTKVAVYCGSERKFSETISPPAQELQPFANVLDQADYRAGVIARCLGQAGLSGQVDAIVLTGGGLLLDSFDRLISQTTGMAAYLCEDPLLCVAHGAGKAVREMDRLKDSFDDL